MTDKQNLQDYFLDQVQQGTMSAAEANIEKVRSMRVFIVQAKIPSLVRKALNTAVKEKVLKHKRKEGMLPEVFYHPEFEYMVANKRRLFAQEKTQSLLKVLSYTEINQSNI